MVGQAVVLLFLEGRIVEGTGFSGEAVGKGCQKGIDNRGVVEDAMKVSAPAAIADAVAIFATIVEAGEGLRGRIAKGTGLAHVNLVG